ncbi:maltooligosyl trehalose synthase [Nannocystis exedens]|uniref:Maltooligosyl trehalose synthase n=1 Tax=Nannocystis exedens TaxID=54 RepID=A0A1I1VLN3_9BACT|nr:malto-oligosyltrehalose synthase [Nannocystis exedens]PCC72650.1 malto-oligosyltrehalose synthase [Nannocystis exedens]SFD83916.1 maltooligosyl trehalose synthase [Nannocystis exedens]
MTIPVSTYRLQLHAGFGFRAAAAITDYLDALGVDAVYTSPYLHAERGSTHGYNVVDHAALGPELGDEADYDAWTDGLRARGLGHVLDFVPNHMGIGSGENRRWNDVLESGQASLCESWFDIEWAPPKIGMAGKVLLPILGRQFGEALEAGELKVVRDGGSFFVAYYERRLPVAIKSLPLILRPALARLSLAADDPTLAELHSVLTAIDHLPGEASTPPDAREERAREKDVIKRRLTALLAESGAIAAAVDATLQELAGRPGDPRSFDALETFLGEQVYRLSFWRVATEEINYRRFFDVNELAAIKMEDPAVFSAAHALVLRKIAEGRITGLRLDHTDGLYDPAAYFEALQAEARAHAPADAQPLYLVIEKILEPGEALPRHWQVDGTTGYDFLGAVGRLWIRPEAGPRLTRFYHRFIAAERDYEAVAYASRIAILRASLSSEIHMLAHRLERIAQKRRRSRDFTRVSLTSAIVETIAAFPVYRTYVRPDGSRTASDDACIDRALRRARRRRPDVDASVFEFLRDLLMLRNLPEEPEERAEAVRFAMRFAQLTGPVIAKGVEDTALYRYNRLVCLNEVGCDPAAFGASADDFHAHNQRQRRRFPRTMTTTATHDTKRGEDVRARLAVLSELPDEWRRAVSAWSRMARPFRTEVDEALAPSRNDAYLFYQTVVGALPLDELGEGDAVPPAFVDRVAAYMEKATREAKERTSWIAGNPEYEAAVQKFVRELLAHPGFCGPAAALARKISTHGAVNGLAQVCLKLASPGVPDTYQGGELWDFSLVDPDNRRPVDYERRRQALADIRARASDPVARARELLASYLDGRIKLMVLHLALQHRRQQRALYLEGSYVPLSAGRHVVAFRRAHGDQELVCVVPRLAYTLTGGRRPWPLGAAWGEQTLELERAATWRDLFTGAEHRGDGVPLADVFAELPVSLLVRVA